MADRIGLWLQNQNYFVKLIRRKHQKYIYIEVKIKVFIYSSI